MSTDKEIRDLSARLDEATGEIERLETLEFETVAFPPLVGFALICDVTLAAPSAAITMCTIPASLPQNFRNLWLVIAAMVDVPDPGKMRMTLDAPVPPAAGAGSYEYYVRQEHPSFGVATVGAADTEAATLNTDINSDEAWKICHPAGFEASGGLYTKQCACLVQIPNYANAKSIIEGDLAQSNSHWGFAVTDIGAVDTPGIDSIDEGGGGRRTTGFANAPVTSVHLAPAVGETFAIGSQFTLYGL